MIVDGFPGLAKDGFHGDAEVEERSERHEESRRALRAAYDQAVAMEEWIDALKTRQTPNEKYPLSVLLRIIPVKTGVSPEPGVVIAAMVAKGFTMDAATAFEDPRFNVSGASRGLKGA